MTSYNLDFFEIESKNNGACSIFSFTKNGITTINLTDCGYKNTFDDVSECIDEEYGSDTFFDNVIVTHNDQDHAGGIASFLQKYKVGKLWMLRPWQYASLLKTAFSHYSSRPTQYLADRLKECYANLYEIEQVAQDLNIPIDEPFQGQTIGPSLVLAPSIQFFFQNILDSEKTPQVKKAYQESYLVTETVSTSSRKIVPWNIEHFPEDDTTPENQMSVVQYIDVGSSNGAFLLTGDAGRLGLNYAIDYLIEKNHGIMPKIAVFEVPHHGSRHNLSSELLDRIFGLRTSPCFQRNEKFRAFVQASHLDDDHPRKTVIRALMHRGASVYKVDHAYLRIFWPSESDYSGPSIAPLEYPWTED